MLRPINARPLKTWPLVGGALAALLYTPPVRADVPIPASDMGAINVYNRSARPERVGSPGGGKQTQDKTGFVFSALLINKSRYRITSLKLEAQEWSGDHILSRAFTLSTRQGKPLDIAPLGRVWVESRLLTFPPGFYNGYFLVIRGVRGVPILPDAALPVQDQLLDAAALGDLLTLRTLLDAHPFLTSAPAPAAGRFLEDDFPTGDHLFEERRQRRQGATPLHLAASGHHEAAVRLLLARGADVNARDAADRTPLLEAIFSADPAIATLLLAHGADPNLACWTWSPLAYARRMTRTDPGDDGPFTQIERMLVKAGAREVPPTGKVRQR